MSEQKDWMNELMKKYEVPNPNQQQNQQPNRILTEQQLKQIKEKD